MGVLVGGGGNRQEKVQSKIILNDLLASYNDKHHDCIHAMFFFYLHHRTRLYKTRKKNVPMLIHRSIFIGLQILHRHMWGALARVVNGERGDVKGTTNNKSC